MVRVAFRVAIRIMVSATDRIGLERRTGLVKVKVRRRVRVQVSCRIRFRC